MAPLAPARLTDAGYWRALAPELTIDTAADPVPLGGGGPEFETARARVIREGYYDHPPVVPPAALQAAQQAVAAVERDGWHPLLAFVYDAPWRLGRSGPVLHLAQALLGPGYRQLPAFRAYHVRPGDRGYRPFNEITDKTVAELPDGAPRAVSIWVPLTEATTENGCQFVVPKHHANHSKHMSMEQYLNEYGITDMAFAQFHLHRARALPLPPGGLLAWEHQVLQWGSFSSDHSEGPLLSMTFEFVQSDCQHPHAERPTGLSPVRPGGRAETQETGGQVTYDPSGPLPSFEQRLFWIARNVRYHTGYRDREALEAMVQPILDRGYS